MELAKLWFEAFPVARKAHRCDSCGSAIAVGSPYWRVEMLGDGCWNRERGCFGCWWLAEALRQADPLEDGLCSAPYELRSWASRAADWIGEDVARASSWFLPWRLAELRAVSSRRIGGGA